MNKFKTLITKFGGSALEDMDHLQRVAEIVVKRKKDYENVVVVVSAMGQTTDKLLEMAKKANSDPPKREQDILLSAGERISMALLAMVFAQNNLEAYSFTGSQSGIITCNSHTNAHILNMKPYRLLPYLKDKKIIIVAGFQGVSIKGDITTLGRGGSDTTAVALGIALGAEKVEFYKDVNGIFECDPHFSPSAKSFPKLTYQEAIRIIGKGEKKVLHPRAVALAEKNHLPLHVLSFKEQGLGSIIVKDGFERMDCPIYEEEYALDHGKRN